MNKGQRIRVSGIVQGVGFRPNVWRLAKGNGIRGAVWNDAEGVLIHAWGGPDSLEEFYRQLRRCPPPLAQIEKIERSALDSDLREPKDFQIIKSGAGMVRTGVAADAASCPECLAETLDPGNRRYRYPFTNCTHCGPRLSIVKAIPYDRGNTSMVSFPLCSECRKEYEDPTDRRFHAQPNACGACGPVAWLEDAKGIRQSLENGCDAILLAAQLIQQGNIVAVKGLGGIHLCCDAANSRAVERLRKRKHRYQKALALMARDLDMVRRFAKVSAEEAQLLGQQSAPIVILDAAGENLPEALVPGQHTLGFMLPYTPLHHLLMLDMQQPVVMTSGNHSEEPQAISNSDARQHLGDIADYFLLHDREIVNRLDDSVQRVMDGKACFLRRARGYAPQPLRLAEEFTDSGKILAMGGELKNTFCLLKDGRAIVSQHIGDLEEVATQDDYRRNLKLYQGLFDHIPDVVAVDSHPDYLSSQFGRLLAEERGVSLIEVHHHHAHIAACMAENRFPMDSSEVLGVALDGLGLGEDGHLWGGEFLSANYHQYERLAHFQNVPMLGAAQAMHEPWRNTFAQLHCTLGWDRVSADYAELDIIRFLNHKPVAVLQAMAEKGLNSPMSSSCGRLFDAVAAAIGICRDRALYEGQAAIELESLAVKEFETQLHHAYPFEYARSKPGVLRWACLWEAILQDLKRGTEPAIIAARFHQGLAQAVAETALYLCEKSKLTVVVLSGGVFQNKLLLERVSEMLRAAGLRVISPLQFPANDGGLALGQAAIAAAHFSAIKSSPSRLLERVQNIGVARVDVL